MMVAVVRKPRRCAASTTASHCCGRQLVRADHGAHLVVEDFRRGARQGAEARVAQPVEIIARSLSPRLCAPCCTSSGEKACTWMRRRRAWRRRGSRDRSRRCSADGCRPACRLRSRRAPRPRARGARSPRGRDRRPGRAGVAELALGEGAEPAAVVADVGVVDVAVDDVAHGVAADARAQRVGGGAHGVELRAPRAGTARRSRPRAAGARRSRVGWPDRARRKRSPAHARRIGLRFALAAQPGAHASSRAKPSASAARSTGVCNAGSSQRSGALRIAGIDGEPLDQAFSGRRGVRPQSFDRGPRRFRIDVIGRDRRDAAPVVDAGRDQIGQAGRG